MWLVSNRASFSPFPFVDGQVRRCGGDNGRSLTKHTTGGRVVQSRGAFMRQLEGTTAVFGVARGKIRPLRVASRAARYAARGRPALSRDCPDRPAPPPFFYFIGGCQPAAAHRRRAGTIVGLFICKAITVARPIMVRPTICMPSALHSKWSDHR
jgi:hypothetical protein